MDSNWKLLRGEQDWNLLQQSIIKECDSKYYNFDGYPNSYPCLVQVHSSGANGRCIKTLHRSYFVYVNDASFLVDFIDGKID